MKTKSIIQFGIALIFLAITAFIYPLVTHTSREQRVALGPLHAIPRFMISYCCRRSSAAWCWPAALS
ncbi:MAG: hypothetical protein EXR70_10910 [Deltaproteobacteria bacterium]|nr:hypothetical protein [Deltaproteobacteria bacterium]